MKKFNLLQKLILLVLTFIFFGFISKEYNLETSNKKVKFTTQESKSILIVYTEKTKEFQKSSIRNCIANNLNITVLAAMSCNVSLNAEIITFSDDIFIQGTPTSGLGSDDDNENGVNPDHLDSNGSKTRIISYEELESAVTECGPSIIGLGVSNSCEDIDGLEY